MSPISVNNIYEKIKSFLENINSSNINTIENNYEDIIKKYSKQNSVNKLLEIIK
jgi:hypothetical protein